MLDMLSVNFLQEVAQRSFSPVDDKQAVLMEMFTEAQLERYKDSLTGAGDHDPTAPDDANSPDATGQPSKHLSSIALTPMILCTLHKYNSAMLIQLMACPVLAIALQEQHHHF